MAFVKRHVLTVYAMLVIAYLMLPIAVVILFSFNSPEGRFNYVWQGFTFDNWLNWDAPVGLRDSVQVSLEIAIGAGWQEMELHAPRVRRGRQVAGHDLGDHRAGRVEERADDLRGWE